MKTVLTLALLGLLSGAVIADELVLKQEQQIAPKHERAALAKQMHDKRLLRAAERKEIAEATRAKKRAAITRKIEKRTVKK